MFKRNNWEIIMKNIKKIISSEKAFSILKKPITTEKSTNLQQFNQYTFFVSKNSNANEIKQVIKINTSIQRGKLKSFKGSVGYRKDTKKAIVTLKEGNTIDSSLEIK